jgi:hypothetical protein
MFEHFELVSHGPFDLPQQNHCLKRSIKDELNRKDSRTDGFLWT